VTPLPVWVAGRKPARTLVRAVALVVVAFACFQWILVPVRGIGISMSPTIADGELVFVNALAYRFRSPRRGDIVAVRLAGRSVVYVKRVVGLPGERLRIDAGVVHVDERPLDEPYVRFRMPWSLDAVELAPDQYFVMGDNRGMPLALHDLGRVGGERLIGVVVF
jgi:signal peptidase I